MSFTSSLKDVPRRVFNKLNPLYERPMTWPEAIKEYGNKDLAKIMNYRPKSLSDKLNTKLIDKRISDAVGYAKGLYDQAKWDGTPRPEHDVYRRYSERGIMLPFIPISALDLQEISRLSAVLSTIFIALKREIFRRGLEIKKNFEAKCINPDCEEEYDIYTPTCPECGGPTRKPDKRETKSPKKFMDKANENDQSLITVLKECEDDLNINDDQYLLMRKRYIKNANREIVGYQVLEILRGDPFYFKIVGDQWGKRGGYYYTCTEHRNDLITNENDKCPVCGDRLYEVEYVQTSGGHGTDIVAGGQFLKGEVFHGSKYNPSLLYGFPPLISLWKFATALLNQVAYIDEYYREGRHPKGIISMAHRNWDEADKQWKKVVNQAKTDPHYIPLLCHDPETKRGKVEFVPFDSPLSEMQFIQTRDEFRQRMSSTFGVSNMFMNDLEAAGGLNSESLQLVVTNRALDAGQKCRNTGDLKWLTTQFGMKDHHFELNPAEERDEATELDLEMKRLFVAKEYWMSGYEVKRGPDGKFIIEGTHMKMREQPQQGMGGLPGSGYRDNPLMATPGSDLITPGGTPHKLQVTKYDNSYTDSLKLPESKITKIEKKNTLSRSGKSPKQTPEQREKRTLKRMGDNLKTVIRYTLRDPGQEYLFGWRGMPYDPNRSSPHCVHVKREVDRVGKGKGVTWSQLHKIILDADELYNKKHRMSKYYPNEELITTPHFNCTHSPYRMTTVDAEPVIEELGLTVPEDAAGISQSTFSQLWDKIARKLDYSLPKSDQELADLVGEEVEGFDAPKTRQQMVMGLVGLVSAGVLGNAILNKLNDDKYSKDDVNYRFSVDDKKCGTCRYFMSDKSCLLVEGAIEAEDTCDLWEEK